MIALAACWFVTLYDQLSHIRYPFDHPDAEGYRTSTNEFIMDNQSQAGRFITAHRTHAYTVPIAGLLAGIVILWRWPKLHVLIELDVIAMWLLGLFWAGCTLIVWQMQNIPIFHGMRFHY
jgi:hypothetical protein